MDSGYESISLPKICRRLDWVRALFCKTCVYWNRIPDITPARSVVMGLANDKEHRGTALIDADVLDGALYRLSSLYQIQLLRFKVKDLIEKVNRKSGHDFV